MKKLLYSAGLTLSIMSALLISSCSNDSNEIYATDAQNAQAVIGNSIDSNTDRGIPVSSHNLIIQNNTDAKIMISDIFATGGPTGPGAQYIIHFKGTQTDNIVMEPQGTALFGTIAAMAPETMSVPYWHVQGEAAHLDVIDTAVKILADYGTRVSNAHENVKYTYWTGVMIAPMHDGVLYSSAVGDIVPANAGYLGNTSFTGFNNFITYSETGFPSITITWEPQSNGDIVVTCN